MCLPFQEKSLCLVREDPPKYNLQIALPFPVDEDRGAAKFDKSKKTLVVTLPVKPGPQLKAERLSSNDSGIEEDTAYRTKLCDEVIMEVNDAKNDNKSDTMDKNEEFRTESEIKVIDDFLEEKISYAYPSFTCSVHMNVITLTLEVKNVSPDSFEKKIYSDPLAVVFKFSSIGSGYVPLHHAFAIGFLSPAILREEDFDVEFWDNNIVINFPYNEAMEGGYKVGPSLDNLCNTLHKLDNYNMETSEDNAQKSKKKKNKYHSEKHPKGLSKANKSADEKRATQEKDDCSKDRNKKIRYCSGDSVDSSMSESPMETIQLYQDDDFGDDEEMRTEDSCDEELQLVAAAPPPRYKRAVSEESQLSGGGKPRRGILKKQAMEQAGRFRCYSESNMEDVGLAASSDKLSFALSEATIAEDDSYNFASGQKKSVSFNEKVQQQFYR